MNYNAYDRFAPFYRDYSVKKANYLNTIDNLVLKNIPHDATKLLDVGAGDGKRAMNIAKKSGITNIILSEPSHEMAKKCHELKPTAVWQTSAEKLPGKNYSFDVILCLWNVLGHIEKKENRMIAVSKMRDLLNNNGILFLDVNNRHNASSYGWIKIFFRILVDFLSPDEKRGDVEINWKIKNQTITAMGHLFTPNEIEEIILKNKLRIIKRIPVDYQTGKIKKSTLYGQLLYILKK